MINYLSAYGSGLIGLFLLKAGNRIYHHKPFRKDKELKLVCESTGFEKIPVKSTSSLVGLFHAGNSHGIVQAVDPECEWADYVETRFTCLGNLILCNDKGALIAPVLKDKKSELEKILGVPCTAGTIAGLQTVGTLGLANSHGVAVHPKATEKEMDLLKTALKVEKAGHATVSKSGFVGAFALAGDNSLILCPQTMAPEMAVVMEILGVE